jgi:hypothetical protein
MKNFHTAPNQSNARIHQVLFLGLMLILLSGSVSAQDSSNNPLDGFTPAGLKPGSPTGSFPLSGFDTINPYNGSLNFSLPLLHVGGRGSAGYTMQQPINMKWTVTYSVTHDDRGGTFEYFEPTGINSPLVPYSPGGMVARQANSGEVLCYGYGDPVPYPQKA